MRGIAKQECRSIENAVWRSRVAEGMTGLTISLTALDNMTSETLEKLLGFRNRALDSHEKLRNASGQLYNDLARLRREHNQMANEFGNLTQVVASQLAGIARVEESADVLVR
jgi:phage-related minor tail protein